MSFDNDSDPETDDVLWPSDGFEDTEISSSDRKPNSNTQKRIQSRTNHQELDSSRLHSPNPIDEFDASSKAESLKESSGKPGSHLA
jgi:hypothetical protein